MAQPDKFAEVEETISRLIASKLGCIGLPLQPSLSPPTFSPPPPTAVTNTTAAMTNMISTMTNTTSTMTNMTSTMANTPSNSSIELQPTASLSYAADAQSARNLHQPFISPPPVLISQGYDAVLVKQWNQLIASAMAIGSKEATSLKDKTERLDNGMKPRKGGDKDDDGSGKDGCEDNGNYGDDNYGNNSYSEDGVIAKEQATFVNSTSCISNNTKVMTNGNNEIIDTSSTNDHDIVENNKTTSKITDTVWSEKGMHMFIQLLRDLGNWIFLRGSESEKLGKEVRDYRDFEWVTATTIFHHCNYIYSQESDQINALYDNKMLRMTARNILLNSATKTAWSLLENVVHFVTFAMDRLIVILSAPAIDHNLGSKFPPTAETLGLGTDTSLWTYDLEANLRSVVASIHVLTLFLDPDSSAIGVSAVHGSPDRWAEKRAKFLGYTVSKGTVRMCGCVLALVPPRAVSAPLSSIGTLCSLFRLAALALLGTLTTPFHTRDVSLSAKGRWRPNQIQSAGTLQALSASVFLSVLSCLWAPESEAFLGEADSSGEDVRLAGDDVISRDDDVMSRDDDICFGKAVRVTTRLRALEVVNNIARLDLQKWYDLLCIGCCSLSCSGEGLYPIVMHEEELMILIESVRQKDRSMAIQVAIFLVLHNVADILWSDTGREALGKEGLKMEEVVLMRDRILREGGSKRKQHLDYIHSIWNQLHASRDSNSREMDPNGLSTFKNEPDTNLEEETFKKWMDFIMHHVQSKNGSIEDKELDWFLDQTIKILMILQRALL